MSTLILLAPQNHHFLVKGPSWLAQIKHTFYLLLFPWGYVILASKLAKLSVAVRGPPGY